MHQAVLIQLQPLLLVRILQLKGIQLLQQRFLLNPLLFGALLLLFNGLQRCRRFTPALPDLGDMLLLNSQLWTPQPVQPSALLTRLRQLGLPLNRDVQQQRAQLQQLLTVHGTTVEPATTRKTIPGLQLPFTADQKIVLALELRLVQPGPDGRCELKACLDPGTVAPCAKQTKARGALGPTEHSIQGIQKDGFSSPCFPGEHGETRAELQFKLINQGDVLQLQTGEHNIPGGDADRSDGSLRLEGVYHTRK